MVEPKRQSSLVLSSDQSQVPSCSPELTMDRIVISGYLQFLRSGRFARVKSAPKNWIRTPSETETPLDLNVNRIERVSVSKSSLLTETSKAALVAGGKSLNLSGRENKTW